MNPEAIPAIVSVRMPSPFIFSVLASHVPVDPVICTSGASGPRLPPEAIQIRDDRNIDGLFFEASRPPLKRMLFTIRFISPGSPMKWITSPASNPAAVINAITHTPSTTLSALVRPSRINQYNPAIKPPITPIRTHEKNNRLTTKGLSLSVSI